MIREGGGEVRRGGRGDKGGGGEVRRGGGGDKGGGGVSRGERGRRRGRGRGEERDIRHVTVEEEGLV